MLNGQTCHWHDKDLRATLQSQSCSPGCSRGPVDRGRFSVGDSFVERGVGLGRASGVFEAFAELLDGTVVLLLGQGVPGRDEQRDGPVDEFQGEQYSDRAVVGQLFWSGQEDGSDYRQVDGEVVRVVGLLGGAPPMHVPRIRSFCGVFAGSWGWFVDHSSPPCFGVFMLIPCAWFRVGIMLAKLVSAGIDPVTEMVAVLLTPPVRVLYLVLLRLGIARVVG
jgi:hypothetical protein